MSLSIRSHKVAGWAAEFKAERRVRDAGVQSQRECCHGLTSARAISWGARFALASEGAVGKKRAVNSCPNEASSGANFVAASDANLPPRTRPIAIMVCISDERKCAYVMNLVVFCCRKVSAARRHGPIPEDSQAKAHAAVLSQRRLQLAKPAISLFA